MRGAAVKDFRRQANKVANQALDAVRPPIEAALRNEQVTRVRVETLEGQVSVMWKHYQDLDDALASFKARNLQGRLRWLLLGR